MSEERSMSAGGSDLVELERGGDGVPWIRLALWSWLAVWVSSSLATLYVLKRIEAGASRVPLELFQAITLAGDVATLLGGAAMAVGLVRIARSTRTRGLRALARLTAGGVAVTLAQLAIELYAQVRGPEVPPPDALVLWSWLVRAACWPVVMTGAVAVLCHVLRRRRAALLVGAVGAISATQAVYFWVSAFDVQIVAPTGAATAVNLLLAVLLFAAALAAAAERRAGVEPVAAPAPAHGWTRAASGLAVIATTMTVRLVLGAVASLLLLRRSSFGSGQAGAAVVIVGLVTGIPILIAMAVGARRMLAAPEPAAARSATAVALVLLLVALFLEGFAVRQLAWLAGGVSAGLPPLEAMMSALFLVARLLEMAGLAALLHAAATLAAHVGDRSAARQAILLAAALIVMMGTGALAFYRHDIAAGGAASIVILVASIGTLGVVVGFAAVARQVAAAVRKASLGPALARAAVVVRGER